MHRRLSILVFVAATLIAHPAKAEYAFEVFRNGIVRVGLIDGNGQLSWAGTGFVIEDNCTFVTAKHLIPVEAQARIVIRFQHPKVRTVARTHDARVLLRHPDKDLLYLRIDQVDGQPCNTGGLHVFSLPQHVPKSSLVGEDTWIIGHPLIGEQQLDVPVLRSGKIASTEISMGGQLMILLDLIGVPGFSGSPVVLKSSGEVIGVVYGPGPTERRYGFEWATPITVGDLNRPSGPPPGR